MRIFMTLTIVIVLLSACSPTANSTHNPTAKEVLKAMPDADIFQFDGIVYQNASEVDWVRELQPAAGEKVGAITKTHRKGSSFRNGSATKLPVGTEIYASEPHVGPLLIVRQGGREIPYTGLIEG
ncbi:hypothetical protein [Paenibacillus cymbidii]|uniref:hypothetical protein n=1 Tax=Paenibacillus cymbidii TaxID=1639034 RepID=UPI0010809A6A|nr:hypothetical protein [Paenibacillus cymbidii]